MMDYGIERMDYSTEVDMINLGCKLQHLLGDFKGVPVIVVGMRSPTAYVREVLMCHSEIWPEESGICMGKTEFDYRLQRLARHDVDRVRKAHENYWRRALVISEGAG